MTQERAQSIQGTVLANSLWFNSFLGFPICCNEQKNPVCRCWMEARILWSNLWPLVYEGTAEDHGPCHEQTCVQAIQPRLSL